MSNSRTLVLGHLKIMRMDHWIKNVFVLPGMVVGLTVEPRLSVSAIIWRTIVGLLATCIIASSNYTINEILDAPFDRKHPTKCRRPVAAGEVNITWGYVQWILLLAIGLGLAYCVSNALCFWLGVLWVMGCIYNIPPIRAKDLPYVDVVTEAVNNPIRMFCGWHIVGAQALVPLSLGLSYWMIGCYFMALKRFAEYRNIGDPAIAASYRKSFRFYNEENLIVSTIFYSSTAMMFLGAFIMRYRLELLLGVPAISAVLAIYARLAFKDDSPVQAPEKLHREGGLLAALVVCVTMLAALMYVDLPFLHEEFAPTDPSMLQQTPGAI